MDQKFYLSGLKNMGNTCYLNTAIQCLLSIPDIAKYFFNKTNFDDWGGRDVLVRNQSKRLGYEFARLSHGLLEEQCIVQPEAFMKSLKLLNPRFNLNQQQDSHEFFLYILNHLHEAMADPAEMQLTGRAEDEENYLLLKAIKDKLKWLWDEKEKTYKVAPLTNAMYFQEHITVECPACGFVEHQFPMTSHLELDISESSGPTTLQNLIAQYCEKKEIELDSDNKWKCDECEHVGAPVKQHLIWNGAKYIIFHLKRFKHQGNGIVKNNVFIDCPLDNLDLTEHINFGVIEKEGFTKQPVIYDCLSVGNHTGGMGGGHYYALVKKDGQWHEVNDTFVRPLNNKGKIVSNHANYLIYKRRD
jgi:ubiquitin C-terminal hydrolase